MRITLAIILAAALGLCGCAARIVDQSRTQYLNETFTAADLQEGGLALLPVTAGDGQEGYRRPLGDYLNARLPDAVPGGRVLSWQAAMDSINNNSKVSAYEQMITGYQKTSIVNRELVRELFATLGVRYALYCSLQDFSEQSKTNYNLFTGFSTTKTAQVIAQCLVIDLSSGDVAQEIIGHTTAVGGDFSTMSPYEAYAAILAQAVLSKLPGSAVPDPMPPTASSRSTNPNF